MRILLICHFFPPEIGAPQVRLSSLAKTWAADGDHVTVLTGMPNYPTGVVPPEYRGSIRRKERRDNYQVVRTWLYATPNEGVVRRTIGHLSFMLSSVLLGGPSTGRADVVIVSSPTLFSIAAGWLLARFKHARFVVEIRDLWPAALIELGILTNRWLIGLLERFELAAYAAADLVVVTSEGFRNNLVQRGVSPSKVHTVLNGVTLNNFQPGITADASLRARLGANESDCLVLYAGTHGLQQGLPDIVDAAKILAEESVHFAFVGEGAEKQRLAQRVAELGLRNVILAPSVPHEEVPRLLAAADICLLIQRSVPLFSISIPAKMSEYLAAQKPVIGAVAGETARLLREAGGVVVPPEDSSALAEAVRELAANHQKREQMGNQGRLYVEQFFDRTVLAREYRKLLDQLTRDLEH